LTQLLFIAHRVLSGTRSHILRSQQSCN